MSPERIDFYNIVITPNQSIPINHPAFKRFTEDFPPPKGYSTIQLHKTTLSTQNSFAISGTLRYTNVDTNENMDVATFEDVRIWAMKDNAGWYSLAIVIVGLLWEILSDIFLWYFKNTSIEKPNE